MRYLALLSVVVILFSSCERDADIPMPEVDPSMSLTCFISPGKPIIARLVRVNPVFQPGIPGPGYIHGATIWISDGNDTSWLVEDGIYNYYRESAPALAIVTGRTYWMGAHSGGLPSVYAKCTVPNGPVAQWQVNYYTAPRGADSSYTISLGWKDRSNEENFYRIYCTKTDSSTNTTSQNQFVFGTAFYNDKGRDGEYHTSMVGEILQAGSAMYLSRVISAHIVHCDVNYFRYHLSLESYIEGSPFGEPTSVYSNVTNGTGCFGAYIEQSLEKKIF